jgi:hypothetical protein
MELYEQKRDLERAWDYLHYREYKLYVREKKLNEDVKGLEAREAVLQNKIRNQNYIKTRTN